MSHRTWSGQREAICAKCGNEGMKRSMTALYVKTGVYDPPRILCHICERCLPALLDELEVSMPEEQEKRPYTPRRWCRKCIRDVGKTAQFCPYCGDELASQIPTMAYEEKNESGLLEEY